MYIKQVKSIHPGNREMNIDTKNGSFGERLFEDRARTTILVPLGQLPHQCPSHGRWRELVQKSPRDQRKLEKKTPKSSTSKAIRSKKYTLPETNIAPETGLPSERISSSEWFLSGWCSWAFDKCKSGWSMGKYHPVVKKFRLTSWYGYK